MGKAALLAPAGDKGAAAANEINDFGLDLLRRMDAHGNLCASPTSIALALAMVEPGARGQTAAEIDQVLGGLGSSDQGAEVVALLDSLKADDYADPSDPSKLVVELDVSNAAFAQQGMTLLPAYLDALSSRFGAGVGLVDYQADPEGARLAINQWASDRTKGRIPAVLKPGDVTELTRIALADAIYLKAGWVHQFDPNDTKLRAFTNASGAKLSVPTMALDAIVPYGAGSGYQAVDLPYVGNLSMTVIVPDNMTTFVQSLDAAKLRAITSGMNGNTEVDLTLPKFSAETRVDLADLLAAMGMPTVFTGAADLSGITTDEPLALAKVIHQANIDVVEEGTTASAVTVDLGLATVGGEPPAKATLHVDKPFLYFIRDRSSGAILFMGRIDDPSTE
jgi:serpin B